MSVNQILMPVFAGHPVVGVDLRRRHPILEQKVVAKPDLHDRKGVPQQPVGDVPDREIDDNGRLVKIHKTLIFAKESSRDVAAAT